MAFSSSNRSISLEDILSKVTEFDILSFYFSVSELPCIIHSPLREDKNPSLGLYSRDGKRVFYVDFSTGDRGSLFDLLKKYWNTDYFKVLQRVYDDIPNHHTIVKTIKNINLSISKSTPRRRVLLQCKVRKWKDHDIEYWNSYGISLEWLKLGDVYPISHTIITKGESTFTIPAEKYAYSYVERKEGRITLKIYQPFSVLHKWSNNHDSSVISLWTKVPDYGDNICICSSLKDALCLWANTGIPSLSVQGEGYNISETAISELKRRYKKIFILFDNDEVGLIDGEKLSKLTGFTNIVLPKINKAKDISDLYKLIENKKKFSEIILSLFKTI